MDKPLISVIVPVYNVESYINRCICSIVGQTYDNLEIILVDDGSPDKCPEICDLWASKDSRIKVIHKANGGLSSARNAGLNVCTGEYVGFVDSDDWVEAEMYKELMDLCENNNIKLAIGGRWDAYASKKNKVVGKLPTKVQLLSSEETLKKILIGDECDSSVCDKLFHKSLWDNIRFPMGKCYEDIAVMYKIILETPKIGFCPKPLYNYYHRAGSIVTSNFDLRLLDYPQNTAEMLLYIKNNYPLLTEYATWTHTKAIQNILQKINSLPHLSYQKYRYVYREYRDELINYQELWESSALFSNRDRKSYRILINDPYARLYFRTKKIIKSLLRKI